MQKVMQSKAKGGGKREQQVDQIPEEEWPLLLYVW